MSRFISVVFSLLYFGVSLADTREYQISGMTCGACKKAISEKVCKLPGVKKCDVEIGKVVLSAAEPIDDATVKTAVAQAGSDYQVVDAKAHIVDTKVQKK